MGIAEVTLFSFICISMFFFMLILASAIRIVPENQRLSVFRLGRYIGEVGPGVVLLIPIIDRAIKKDVRNQVTQLQEDERIWGAIGNTVTVVHTEGDVEISGEMWNAISDEPIPIGERVRVKRIILEVERI